MTRAGRLVVPLVLALCLMSGCSVAPASREGQDELIGQAAAALAGWNREVPGIEGFARRSHGYAMFPGMAKGGVGLGAAYGRGVVYEIGDLVGYADLSEATLGLQVGGQAYQALLVFDSKVALARFKEGEIDFVADTSGVILEAGYVVSVRFMDGITVFARPIGGLMGEAALGGRRSRFVHAGPPDPGAQAPPAAGTRLGIGRRAKKPARRAQASVS